MAFVSGHTLRETFAVETMEMKLSQSIEVDGAPFNGQVRAAPQPPLNQYSPAGPFSVGTDRACAGSLAHLQPENEKSNLPGVAKLTPDLDGLVQAAHRQQGRPGRCPW